MSSLVHLKESPVQKVLLTATLAPRHEEKLAESTGTTLDNALVLRSPTARPNHIIQFAIPSIKTPLLASFRLASLLLAVWDDKKAARGIIFVRCVDTVKETISQPPGFPICGFYGSMPSEQKEEQLKSWLSDTHPAKWIVATTALLHGIDYPRVDAVIFVNLPHSLYDFIQGAGRAGRSGQKSLITVIHTNISATYSTARSDAYGYRQDMENVAGIKQCRRVTISTAMDGDGVACHQIPNSLPCDFCSGGLHPLVLEAISQCAATPHYPTTTPVPSTSTPPVPPGSRCRSAQVPSLQPPPAPSPTAPLHVRSPQVQVSPRQRHAESVKRLMKRLGGCFACRLQKVGHGPCHDSCGRSESSSCLVSPHRIFSCTQFSYSYGWIDWKKNIKWPRESAWRCYFCGLPSSVAGPEHIRSPSAGGSGKCQFSDTAVAAAWYVVNNRDLFDSFKSDFKVPPESSDPAEFAVWLSGFVSPEREIGILTLFRWLYHRLNLK